MLEYIIQTLWIIATIMIFMCGTYFCFKLNFIHLNIKKMIQAITKKKSKEGSISAFQSLAMSLAGKIGVGSLSGIALAIYLGGPGVIFWIWLTSFLCATNSFAESVLAVVFRKKDEEDTYRGGPFYYIKEGLGNKKLAIIYALIVLISFICGFMPIQVNTVSKSINAIFSVPPIIIGLVISFLVGITILGGVKKIANVTSKLVPFMTIIYFLICSYIIIKNYVLIPKIIKSIFENALNIKAFGFGMISTMLIGMQKGIFSSEVGLGTGAIAIATADTNLAGENGMVEAFGIHFENILTATITALVICMCNYQVLNIPDANGIEITLYAFTEHLGSIGPLLVTIIITLFGLATALTGYYYGESSLKFIKKTNKFDILLLKVITICALFFSSIASSKVLWQLTDIVVGVLAIINIYAIYNLKDIVIEEYRFYKTGLKRVRK